MITVEEDKAEELTIYLVKDKINKSTFVINKSFDYKSDLK